MNSDPLINRTIGNYEIIDRLGKGGMATVYRARQTNMQRDVALKIMSAELAGDAQFIARFEREAQVLANLEHPRILPVHDFGHEGELFYLVMRLVEGDSLYDRLTRDSLSLKQVGALLDQIASALDYAHEQGVIHRDLKPNNVLLDRHDNVYLMDFGVAKLMAATQNLTVTGAVMGTPAYMAPEQWRGGHVDSRTDVYSLGVMLYEMVVGSQPFIAADTPFTLMYKHLNDLPTPPRERLPALPEAVDHVILKAMAKLPEDRYQSAGELARAFRAALRGAAVPVSDAPTPAEVEPQAGTPGPAGPATPLPSAESADVPAPDLAAPISIRPLGEFEAPEGQPITGEPSHSSAIELPANTPPKVREIVERVAASHAWRSAVAAVESSLEAAVEKAAEVAPSITPPGLYPPNETSGDIPLPPKPGEAAIAPPEHLAPPPTTASVPREMADLPVAAQVHAPAFQQMRAMLNRGETLVGVLDVRGTTEFRLWKQLAVGGLLVNILGGIMNAGLLSLLGVLAWLYLLVQVIRVWRGYGGHFYLGFTPQRVVLLPRTPEGALQASQARTAQWASIERLKLTDRVVLLSLSGAKPVQFAGLIPTFGDGGLGEQANWLPYSPIPQLIRQKGFEANHEE